MTLPGSYDLLGQMLLHRISQCLDPLFYIKKKQLFPIIIIFHSHGNNFLSILFNY